MNKVYLLVYSELIANRSTLKRWAEESGLVVTWRYDLPNCFYLVSEASAKELSDELTANFGLRFRFLITEISENREGGLPVDTWAFLQNKRAKSLEESGAKTH